MGHVTMTSHLRHGWSTYWTRDTVDLVVGEVMTKLAKVMMFLDVLLRRHSLQHCEGQGKHSFAR